MNKATQRILSAISSLRTYSEGHHRFVEGVLREIMHHYAENLLGLAIFGSYARGENRKDSDLDLLIILKDAPRRRLRLVEFIQEIEMKHDSLAQQLFSEQGLLCELSPYIVTECEALLAQPIYYDLVDHHVIVFDPHRIVFRIIKSTSALLRQVGAQRIRRNNTWEWRTNRFLGGIQL